MNIPSSGLNPYVELVHHINNKAPVAALRQIQQENASNDFSLLDQESVRTNIRSCQEAIDVLSEIRNKIQNKTPIQSQLSLDQLIPELTDAQKNILQSKISKDIDSLKEIKTLSQKQVVHLEHCCVIL